jgi:pimeloyl-ACP methyl ester carboxylesterase
MSLARFLGVCAITVGATASHAQVLPTNKAPDPALISDIPQKAQKDFYSKRREATRKSAPRIIFVPGILGSKIDECRADHSGCINIWGTNGALTQGDIDLSIRPDRFYQTDVVGPIFFKSIYGQVIDYIRTNSESIAPDTKEDPLVTIFHYDWRLSNGENAKRLKERVCEVRAHATASPIVIIAHSMGGLVTKVWAKRHAKEPCTTGEKPEVKQIVFVATPHLGSPKAIKAIAEGYNMLFDELTGFFRILGAMERNTFLLALNQAGFSFPSLYELLPIRTRDYCRQQKPDLDKAANPINGDDNKPINLFDVDTWRRYQLLRRIGAPVVERSYYDHDLEPLLRQAELLLCEIVDFDPEKVTEEGVVYLFGREKDDKTYGTFDLRSGQGNSIYRSTTIQGDGTVPTYSAQNFLISSTRQIMEVSANHTSIISSATMLKVIKEWYRKAIKHADLETGRASPQYASMLVAETAASGKLIPVSINAEAWSQEEDRFAIEINTRALTAMGYQPSDVARFASTAFDATERANLFAVAASSTKEPSQRLTWIADSARSSYDAARFDDAIRTATFVAATAAGVLGVNDPKTVSLQKTAEQVQGWAYLRAGDTEKFNNLAASYAAKYAVAKDDFKEPTSRPPNQLDLERYLAGSGNPYAYWPPPPNWLTDTIVR